MSTDQYQNKYRIPSARAPWHGYDGGIYFITICTKNREHFFGEIVCGDNDESEMQLSEIGKYAMEQIQQTPKIRPDMNLDIPLYVIMPNHIHLIVIIGNNKYNTNDCRDAMHCVSRDITNKFGPQRKNLPSVIRGIKSAITKHAHENNIPFAWQTRFHDRIVRDQNALNRIAEYIENNVAQWNMDCNNKMTVETQRVACQKSTKTDRK